MRQNKAWLRAHEAGHRVLSHRWGPLCPTRHANRPSQEVAQRGEAAGCSSSWLEPRVCGAQGLAEYDSLGPGAVAVLVQQHHRAPEDGSLQVIRRGQEHACTTEKPKRDVTQ